MRPPLTCKRRVYQHLLLLRDRRPSDRFFGSNDRWRLRDVLAEDLGSEEPWEPDEEFVADELLGRDLEDLCDLCE